MVDKAPTLAGLGETPLICPVGSFKSWKELRFSLYTQRYEYDRAEY